jgi:uroporphyrinogen-III synthase
MRRLVILRPEPGASQTAERARAMGLSPLVIALFDIEPQAWSTPDATAFDALLITSANVLRCGGPELQKLQSLQVYAVGEATAEGARKAGFAVEKVGTGGVDSLLAQIAPATRLLHLCGADRRIPKEHHAIQPLVVYRSVQRERPGDLEQLEGSVIAVHSERAGGRLDELCEQAAIDRSKSTIAAISDDAAGSAGVGWQSVEVAALPSDAELLALAARLCQNG